MLLNLIPENKKFQKIILETDKKINLNNIKLVKTHFLKLLKNDKTKDLIEIAQKYIETNFNTPNKNERIKTISEKRNAVMNESPTSPDTRS